MCKLEIKSAEVLVTEHCNLSCYNCDHASPLRATRFLSLETLKDDLDVLARVCEILEFRLTGGEPLLHPAILDVIATVRASKIARKITLVTNGTLLHKAPERLWDDIDILWVSAYPGVKTRVTRDEVMAKSRHHDVLTWWRTMDSFSARLLQFENKDPELVARIYRSCTNWQSCRLIHEGRLYKCSTVQAIPAWLNALGIEPGDLRIDSVAIHGNPDLRSTLEHYLPSEEPMESCRYCRGCSGPSQPVHQMNKAALQDWLDERQPVRLSILDAS